MMAMMMTTMMMKTALVMVKESPPQCSALLTHCLPGRFLDGNADNDGTYDDYDDYGKDEDGDDDGNDYGNDDDDDVSEVPTSCSHIVTQVAFSARLDTSLQQQANAMKCNATYFNCFINNKPM